MIVLNKTLEFNDWLYALKDKQAKMRILARLRNASYGNFGLTKSVGGGVFEMKIDVGAGYRVYYARQGEVVYLLLSGGNKSTQDKDIKQAKATWKKLKKELKHE